MVKFKYLGVNAMDYAILSGTYKLAYFLKNKYD